MHGGIGGEDAQQADRQQQGAATNAIRNRTADGQPDKVAQADEERDHQTVAGAQVQYRPAKSRGVDGNEIERGGGHRR
ncbi:hypothetical protein D9M71_818010 [compost metagenome]